jgi:23S rRNA (uracil1939-C5)-methyltransferase
MARRSGGLRFQPSGGTRKVAVPTGKKQLLNIERMADDGRGIGFVEGRTWFVSGALPGEEVQARVLASRGQIVDARTEQVTAASALRQDEPCPWARRCGGCTLQHLGAEEQLLLKQRTLADQLLRQGQLVPQRWAEPLTGPAFGYRRRARIAVRWNDALGRLEVGFRESSSQAIVGVDDCIVLVPPLRPLLNALPGVLGALEQPRAIGHVELFQGDAAAVLVRHTRPLSTPDLVRLQAFCATHAAQLWLQGSGAPTAYDPAALLTYSLPAWALTLEYRPGDFIQVNAAVNEAMVVQALDWLGPLAGKQVLDLFSGLGNFSLPMAREAAQVVGVEGAQDMVARANGNARRNGIDNAHFFQADLSKPLVDVPWGQQAYDIVVLDPPREGALEIVRQAAAWSAERVLYVSCNPATLARDAAELIAHDYKMVRAGVMDMFPQTAHVEAMALFERR